MKRLMASTAILLALGACASQPGMDLPSTQNSPEIPRAVNAMASGVNTTIPTLNHLFTNQQQETSSSGVKRPNRAEMKGTTWETTLDPNSEYVVPVKTTNETGSSPVQQTLVTADLPLGEGVCSHKGFEAVPFGAAIAVAAFPGAPVGAEASCSVMVGGQIAKLVVKATGSRSISELRFKTKRRKGAASFPKGACSDANYSVSRMVRGGPLGACTVVDASGANTATYFTLPGNTDTPIVKIGDGVNARLARSSVKRLSSGEYLVSVQGSHNQLVLQFPNGEYTALTRGY